MPIYEYQCRACGHQFEILQKMTDEPMTTCPVCQKPALSKLLSAAGLQFKGSGWYLTDYSNKGKERKDSANDIKKDAQKVEASNADSASPAAAENVSKPVKETTANNKTGSSDKSSSKSGESS